MVSKNEGEQQEEQIVDGGADIVDKPRGTLEPYPPKDKLYEKSDTPLFIGISSFRDSQCPKTVYDLYRKAKHPERITIGIVQQWKSDEDIDCLEGYCMMVKEQDPEMWEASGGVCPYFHQVKILRLDYREALGCCYARHFQSYMLRDEEFCMQIDSHTTAIHDWDKQLMDMWARANNEYGILSVYPRDVKDKNMIKSGTEHNDEPHLCQISFTGKSKREPRYKPAFTIQIPDNRPLLSNGYAGGFSFGKCHSWKAVPYDPKLKMVFNGEEFSMASRLWTWGYDLYAPDRSVIYHDYNHSGQPGMKKWFLFTDEAIAMRKEAYEHLDKVLGLGEVGDPSLLEMSEDYGLGDRRSWLQLQEFIGMNLTTFNEFADGCRRVEWVPFIEGPWPPTVNNLKGQYWEERIERESFRKQLLTEEVSAMKNRQTSTAYDVYTYMCICICLAPLVF